MTLFYLNQDESNNSPQMRQFNKPVFVAKVLENVTSTINNRKYSCQLFQQRCITNNKNEKRHNDRSQSDTKRESEWIGTSTANN